MRQIFFDTETTGFLDEDPTHRIVELGCVEMIDRELTGNNLHLYFNPGRESSPDALKVHGLTTEFLSQYGTFQESVDQIIQYLTGAELFAHNAKFDISFLNSEFKRAKKPLIETFTSGVVDTLEMAKSLYPGQRNNLDALCKRLKISNAHRTLHGALLDSELLAQVYLAMTRGQFALLGEEDSVAGSMAGDRLMASSISTPSSSSSYHDLPIILANEQELEAHQQYVEVLDKAVDGTCLWHQFE